MTFEQFTQRLLVGGTLKSGLANNGFIGMITAAYSGEKVDWQKVYNKILADKVSVDEGVILRAITDVKKESFDDAVKINEGCLNKLSGNNKAKDDYIQRIIHDPSHKDKEFLLCELKRLITQKQLYRNDDMVLFGISGEYGQAYITAGDLLRIYDKAQDYDIADILTTYYVMTHDYRDSYSPKKQNKKEIFEHTSEACRIP